MKTKKAIGRPKQPPSDKEKRMVYISPQAKDFYLAFGEGNFSRGMELACKFIEELRVKKG